MWVEPKTDWTGSDVYNIDVDLTRVEGNIHEISEALEALGYAFTLSEKLTWTKFDFLSAGELSRIVGNLEALEEAVQLLEGLPALSDPPDQDFFTADTANTLEKHTLALWQVTQGTAALAVPCGVMASGARPILPF